MTTLGNGGSFFMRRFQGFVWCALDDRSCICRKGERRRQPVRRCERVDATITPVTASPWTQKKGFSSQDGAYVFTLGIGAAAAVDLFGVVVAKQLRKNRPAVIISEDRIFV